MADLEIEIPKSGDGFCVGRGEVLVLARVTRKCQAVVTWPE